MSDKVVDLTQYKKKKKKDDLEAEIDLELEEFEIQIKKNTKERKSIKLKNSRLIKELNLRKNKDK